MKKTTVVLTDDLTGEDADETVSFAIDGIDYEIDLANISAAKLRRSLGGYIEVARRMKGAKPARIGSKNPVAAADNKDYRATVRHWAREHNVPFAGPNGEVRFAAERGRVADELFDKYERRDRSTGRPAPADVGATPEPELVHSTVTPKPARREHTRRKSPAKLSRR